MSILDNPTNCHKEATPLFEVSSVTIRLDGYRKVYGYIRLIDDNDDEFPVFNRVISEPVASRRLEDVVTLSKYHLNRPYWLPNRFRLKLYLKDKIEGTRIFDDHLLDFGGDVVFDEEQVLNVKGCVTVHYTIFQCAMLAFVKFTIIKNDDERPNDVFVRGTITASSKVKSGKRISRVLFDDNGIAGSRLVTEFPNEFPAVGVPAYSSLEIEVDLEVQGQEITGVLEFEPSGSRGIPDNKEIDGGQLWRIGVSVSWAHAFDLLDSYEFCELVTTQESRREGEGYPNCELVSSNQVSTERIESSLFKLRRNRAEVFSVSVHSFGHDVSSFYGTIMTYDSYGKYTIFERDEEDPVKVDPTKILPLRDNRSYKCKGIYFGMALDLKDAEGREISEGYIGWNCYSERHWRERRICSIVKGKEGFAAVHYTIFDKAVLAHLKVGFAAHFEAIPGGEYQINGTIYARYDCYKYTSLYEKIYYSSILFKKDDDAPEILMKPDADNLVNVPLSKHRIALPVNACLIVEVDLHIRASDGQTLERIKGEQTLKPSIDTVIGRVPGSNSVLLIELQCT